MSDAYMMPPAAEQDDQEPKAIDHMLEYVLREKRSCEEKLATLNTLIEILQEIARGGGHFSQPSAGAEGVGN